MNSISFTVEGRPAQQGSKRAFKHKHTGKIVMLDMSANLKPWRTQVSAAARSEMRGEPPTHDAVRVFLFFTFQRPKNHYGTGKNAGVLKAGRPRWYSSAPDIDKLSRACLDAMTGIAYRDDSQVAGLTAEKAYGDAPGVRVVVEIASEESP